MFAHWEGMLTNCHFFPKFFEGSFAAFINQNISIMLNAKQLTVALVTGLAIWFGTTNASTIWQRITSPPQAAEPAPAASPNTIQVALLLDTSNSMDGLIEQAKSQLWKILNELNRMRKDQQIPRLQVALYEYGNEGHARQGLQINQLSGFTTDMDLISEKLFSLKTNGGEEYCGTVIQASLDELQWLRNDGMRVIYIAGNEPFTQGPTQFSAACANAVEKGIVVNTIHCGDCEEGVRGAWQAGAIAGKGEYFCINQNQETVYIQTPYDDEINRLNAQLNDTYIPMGRRGEEKKMNQSIQDSNAAKYSKANASERAAFKSSKNYKADDWDLVDAYKRDKEVVQHKEDLPENMRNLNIEEMERQIQAISAQRESLQAKMQELDLQRRQYIEQERSKQPDASSGLENAILQSVRKQAAVKGFEMEKL